MTRPAPPLAFSCATSANNSNLRMVLGILSTILAISNFQSCNAAYYGKSLGKLTEFHHGVSGEVFAVDGRTIFIKDFTYDGEGPAAYFYAGNSKAPIVNGFRIRDERGTNDNLRRYRKEGVTLTLPEGKTLSNIKWFAIWCDDFSVNFGDVRIPRNFDYPRPQKLAQLKGIHGVESEPVVVVDAQTLLIPGFSYDGEAPDAKFWAGPGANPTPQGIKIPDENGKTSPLRKYDHKTIVLTLPGDLTIHQLGHFGVWCEAFTVDFAHVDVPQALNVPPSLKMLGISPQNMRGGQGQLAYHGSVLPVSASQSLPQSHHEDSGDHRITTYRPILRRNDQFEVVQSIDYRIPKNLQLQVSPYPQNVQEYLGPRDISDRRDALTRNVQFDNSQSGFPHGFRPQNYQNYQFLTSPPQQALEYPQAYNQNNYYRPEQQQGSYARFLGQQGNQQLNSFVRY